MYVCISGLHHQFRQLFGLTMIEIDKKILINNSYRSKHFSRFNIVIKLVFVCL